MNITEISIPAFGKTCSIQFVLSLFNGLRDVQLFAKNRACEFILVDEGFVRMMHCDSKDDILGKTDVDFFPPHLIEEFRRDDLEVMNNNTAILGRIELIATDDLTMDWHETNKYPMHDLEGNVVGLIATTVKLSPTNLPGANNPLLGQALEYISQNFSETITLDQLSQVSKMSIRSLERHFVETFKMTPMRYVKRVRINAACHLLSRTKKSIAEVALDCGFCDQSYMTHQFKHILQLTPRQYRTRFSRRTF